MANKIKNLFFIKGNDGKLKIKGTVKTRCLPALFLFMMMLLFFAFNYYTNIIVINAVDIALLAAMGFVLLAALTTFIIIARKSNEPIEYEPVITSIAFGMISYLVCETVNSGIIFKDHIIFTLSGIFLNTLPFILGTVLFKKPKIWFGIWLVFMAAFCILQYYLLLLRGAPVRLADIHNIKSGLAIKEEYSFELSAKVIFALIAFIITLIWLISMHFKKSRLPKRAITLTAAALCTILITFSSKNSYNSVYGLGMWLPEETVSKVGSLTMVYYDLLNNHVYKSQDYSDEQVVAILNKYKTEEKDIGTPIVLVVLNESLADHTIIDDFSVNKDALPNWRALKENTVKGYVTVSPYGNGTCNAEYEFLTGNSMLFLPDGTGVYSEYINSHIPSIVDTFNEYGFDTVGISPVRSTLWDVGKVYDYLGFDRTYFNDGPNALDLSGDMDSDFYKELYDIADNRDKSKGLFIMAATMQNHAPFDEYRSTEIKLEEPYDKEAEVYLNSIYMSDKATLELIDHFRDYDEKVIIVMFGDHFPKLPDFDSALFAKHSETSEMEKNILTHQTPFFIWCNQDIDEKEIDEISLNYLSNEVMKAAGIPLTPVQQEFEHIRQDIPVIAGWGYKDNSGNWYSKAEFQNEYQKTNEYQDILNEYSAVCYYRLFRQN